MPLGLHHRKPRASNDRSQVPDTRARLQRVWAVPGVGRHRSQSPRVGPVARAPGRRADGSRENHPLSGVQPLRQHTGVQRFGLSAEGVGLHQAERGGELGGGERVAQSGRQVRR